MISAKNGKSVFIANLERNKQGDSFYTVVSSVNVVTHKQVIGVRRWTANSEEFFEIMELPMDISTNSYRCSYRWDIAFVDQDLFGLYV